MLHDPRGMSDVRIYELLKDGVVWNMSFNQKKFVRAGFHVSGKLGNSSILSDKPTGAQHGVKIIRTLLLTIAK